MRPPYRAGGPRIHPAVAVLAILLVSLLAYANSFACEFVFDDWRSIRDNALIRHLGDWWPGGPGYTQRPGRWVGYLSFALNYAAGGLDVTGYHAVNLAIHAICAVLVHALVMATFRTDRLERSALVESSPAIALAAALLFAAHPVQSQAVTYVVQRLTSLATLFYLLAVVLYARWRRGAGSGRPAWRRALGYLSALAAAVLAMKTKEIAFTLPAAVALYELVFLEGTARRRVAYVAPVAATAVLVPLSLLSLHGGAVGILASAGTATRVQTEVSRWDYLATQLTVIATYLRLLVLPVGQNIDHDVPLRRSFLEPGVVGALALAAVLLAAAVVLLWRTSSRSARPIDPAARLVAFGICWFFLALAVESSVIPIMDLIYEHRVYLPSVGFFVAVAAGGALLARRFTPSPWRAVLPVAGALALVLAGLTLARNRAWASSLTLWTDAVEKSPGKTRPHTNLALALAAAGRHAEALEHFEAVVRISPNHVDGYNNLAVALERAGRVEEAARALEVALALKPDHAETCSNLGRIRLAQGRGDDAVELLRKAIALDPSSASAHANLGGALNRLGRPAETVQLLEGKEPILRQSVEARFNLGVAYVLLGDARGAGGTVSVLSHIAPDRAEQLAQFMRSRNLR